MTNGLVDPSPPFNELLLLTLPLVLVIVTLRFLRRKESRCQRRLAASFSPLLLLLALVTAINEVLQGHCR